MEGLGVNTALAALGAYRFKCAIIVDEDVDIYDDGNVMWAVMTRTQADRLSLPFIHPGASHLVFRALRVVSNNTNEPRILANRGSPSSRHVR